MPAATKLTELWLLDTGLTCASAQRLSPALQSAPLACIKCVVPVSRWWCYEYVVSVSQ
eukprot:m.1488484 g.1488484  ORF g.1488484 m.1488484 type:complete len:58 (-) comp25188_c0_seq6:220-393(-)